jgi:aryl-alcohol dehydrogenase-like predicted oxidoreductase
MSLIDTSGDYGNGRSEKLIGRAIAGQRDRVFLVSKVEAHEVSGDGMARACLASLSRLGTNFLDLMPATCRIFIFHRAASSWSKS